jgi:hypothetical protein
MASHLHRNNADSDLAQHVYCQNNLQIVRRVAHSLATWRNFWPLGQMGFHSENVEIWQFGSSNRDSLTPISDSH